MSERRPADTAEGQAVAPARWSWRRPPTPTSGVVSIRGKERPVATVRPRPTTFGRRYAVAYDVEGPRVRMGLLWFGLVVAALVLGPIALVPLYSVMAALAGYQSARAWRGVGSGADPWLAGLGAGAIAGSAAFGIGLVGLSVLVLCGLAVIVGAIEVGRRSPVFEAAGTTVQCALFVGFAAASVALTLRLEIGAVATLVLLVSAYEAADFVVGSGASSSIEGPIAGIVTMAVVTGVIAVLRVPPFDGAAVYVFGGFAAVCCPLGQLAGSAILPRADAKALGLRRLDSLIVLGPVWVLLIGIYLQRIVHT